MNQIKDEMASLAERLRSYQYHYYVEGRSLVSDQEYDRLFDRLTALEVDHPELAKDDSPTTRVGSDLTSDFPEVDHSIPVLSLDKSYTLEEIESWSEKTRKNAGVSLSYVLEEKIDGVSIVLYYEDGVLVRAVTRGNGRTGNDVTANVKTIGSVPLRLNSPESLAVRGEIYLPLERFEELNARMEKPFANPRNLTAGTLRRAKSREVASVPLTMFAYEGFFAPDSGLKSHVEVLSRLADLGFRTNHRTVLVSSDFDRRREAEALGFKAVDFTGLDGCLKAAIRDRDSLGYEIDGLVLKTDELAVREILGYTGHHPRWALAYKFESPTGESEVMAIDVQVGRTGRITPVARISPVAIGGSVVSNVTLHNQDYIDMLELSVGDRVTVSKRGDVIPAVEGVTEKSENPLWKMPEKCPSCGDTLVIRGAHQFCSNSGCPDIIRGRLRFFVSKSQMDLDTLGPETLEVFLSQGWVRTPADLFSLDLDPLLQMDGFGEKKIDSHKKALAAAKERPFVRVLSSLGLPDLGPKVCERLIDGGYRSWESMKSLGDSGDLEALLNIDGIGDKTAASILSHFNNPEVRTEMGRLASAGLQMTASEPKESGDNRFAGQSWCVTGSFEKFKPRSLASDEIKARGGRVVTSVTGKTTHLLAGEKAGSKRQKASDLGIKIVSEPEFLALLEG